MKREAGRTQGFGRVSPVTRPSPYSPVQFRGGSTSATAAPTVEPGRGRVVGRAAAVGAAIAAVAGMVAWFTAMPASQSPQAIESTTPSAPQAAPAATAAEGKPRVSTTLPQPANAPRS